MQDVDRALSDLARRTNGESWTTKKYQLLAYLKSLFKAYETSETNTLDLREYISTGLYNGTEEGIFMVLAANETKEEFTFVKWTTINEIDSVNLLNALKFPFKPEFAVNLNVDHILVDNELRLRQDPKYSKIDKGFKRTVSGDIMATLDQLKVIYQKGLAPPVVPFYCIKKEEIQFLAPISGTSSVLILRHEDYNGRKQYNAVTVLTMEMAYTNARLLGRENATRLKKIIDNENQR